ncbi:MAG: type IV pilin protein [Pseudomonadota bacterium]|nr:type IV pilin protein [Pseudomonadota bacterium]
MKLIECPVVMVARQRAFTLVELMVVVVVVAILASIALPSYTNYIVKSEIRSSQADLLALSLNLENRYQRTLAYPVVAAGSNNTAGLKAMFTAWSPSASNFAYSLSETTATTYTLKATGSGRQNGCSITITHTNTRATVGCKYGDGNWL